MENTILTWLMYFAVYAFLGWVTEVVFFTLKEGKFVNRGFLNGPLCPIYGFGVVGVVLLLEPIKDTLILLFLGATIICTAIEFVTGAVLKKLFHDTWWDYSKEPFNIKGYVCLRFSIMWGLACVLVVRGVHPSISDVVEMMPVWLEIVIAAAFYIFLVCDLIVTVRGINKVNKGLKIMAERMHDISDTTGYVISEAARLVDEKGDEIKENIDERVEELSARESARMDAFIAFMTDPNLAKQRRLRIAFPTMHENFKDRILRETGEDFREQMEELFEKISRKVD